MTREEFLQQIEEEAREDVSRRALNSPCYSCQYFREEDLIDDRYVFILPNSPKFADRTTLHAWCIIEVLDRFLAPLYEGKSCPYWESRDRLLVLTSEGIKQLHPLYRGATKNV